MLLLFMTDSKDQALLLARDKFGIKPLYTYSDKNCFVFSSEIAAMRPWIEFEPDILSISSYAQGFAGPMKGASFYRNVRIVAPGSIITLKRSKEPQYETFFSLSDLWDDDLHEQLRTMKTAEVIDTVDEKMLSIVKMQLAADAPVGALCSGGVDSSIIMAMAAKFHNNLAIFHANVVGPESEYEAARALSKHLKLDLKAVDVNESDFIDNMPLVTRHYGHPFLRHPNSVPFLMVSQLVRANNVKAVLSGEGADECYHGYPVMIPNTNLFLKNIHKQRPTRSIKQLKQMLRGDYTTPMLFDPTGGLANRFEIFMEHNIIQSNIKKVSRRRIKPADLTSLFFLGYHLRTLLHRNDCLGMASGIEARFPFLDSSLVATAVNLPYRYKVRFSPLTRVKKHPWLRDKWILRQVAKRYLPDNLSQRKKNRMNIPAQFFSNSRTRELLELSRDEMQHMFEHCDQKTKVRLLHLEVWAHTCLWNLADDEIISKMRNSISIKPA